MDDDKNIAYSMQRRFNNTRLNINPVRKDNVHIHGDRESITSIMKPRPRPNNSAVKKMQYALTSHGNR